MELLGIDFGEKRIGLALGSLSTGFSVPHGCIERHKGKTEDQLLKLIKEFGITHIVAGMPYNLDGSKNDRCLRVESFCRRLTRRASIQVVYVDEHLTSFETEQRFKESEIRSRRLKGKGAVDAVSAALILQTYLDGVGTRTCKD